MADNYLEKRMEDYRRSQGAAARRPAGAVSRPGRVIVAYPAVRVLVADGCTTEGQAIIEAMRRMQCRVAFTGDDADAGTRLARSSGAQFHPASTPAEAAARLADAGDPPAYIIAPAADGVTIERTADGARIHTPAPCATAAERAAWAVYAIHPAADWLWQ